MDNKVRRNLWLALSLMSVVAVIDRAVRVADGRIEWWNLVSAVCIFALCTKFYLCYRRQVKAGNLDGKVNPLRK